MPSKKIYKIKYTVMVNGIASLKSLGIDNQSLNKKI